jgi:preprotein translocase subunit SecF
MDDYFGKNYKKYIIIPAIIAAILLFLVFVAPGVSSGIDLTGGNVIILRTTTELNQDQIESVLRENFDLEEMKVSTIASPTGFGAWIEYSKDPMVSQTEEILIQAEKSLDEDEKSIAFSNEIIVLLGGDAQEFSNSKLALLGAQDALAAYKEEFSATLQTVLSEKLNLGDDVEFQKKEISQTLGAASFEGMVFIAIIGFILIAFVIFIAFRQVVPSGAIIAAMVFDILAGLAGMALLNIPLSLTTMPALLLLIGYSVDTDIMLTSRLLKERSGTPGERATVSMKTGLTMTGTTLAALLAMIIVSYFYQIEVIYHISAILLFGLIGDVISTWLMNAPILLWFMEKKKR